MVILSIWIFLFLIEIASQSLQFIKKEVVENLNKFLFPFLILSLGILHGQELISIESASIFNSSFGDKSFGDQIGQVFIFAPLLIILLNTFKWDEWGCPKNLRYLFFMSVMTVMSSYNIYIIFFAFIFYEIFFIENGTRLFSRSKGFKKCKGEDRDQDLSSGNREDSPQKRRILRVLALFPFVNVEGPYSRVFFVFLLIFNILDIFSTEINRDKEVPVSDQLFDMTVFFPLRMTILLYYMPFESFEDITLHFVKIIFLISIVISSCHLFVSKFRPSGIMLVGKILFFGITLSNVRMYYMEFYFLLVLICMYGSDVTYRGKNERCFLIGPILLALFTLSPGWTDVTKILTILIEGSLFSKILALTLIFFLTLWPLRWGRMLRRMNFLKMSEKNDAVIRMDKFSLQKDIGNSIFFMAGILILKRYNLGWHDEKIEWSSRVIIILYFIIVFLISYIANFSEEELKGSRRIISVRRLNRNSHKRKPLSMPKIVEVSALVLFRMLTKIFKTVHEIFVNALFILTDYLSRIKLIKYQSWSSYILIIFMLFLVKIFQF